MEFYQAIRGISDRTAQEIVRISHSASLGTRADRQLLYDRSYDTYETIE